MGNIYTEIKIEQHELEEKYENLIEDFIYFHNDYGYENRGGYAIHDNGIVAMALVYTGWENDMSVMMFDSLEECVRFCYDELNYYEVEDYDETIAELKEEFERVIKL